MTTLSKGPLPAGDRRAAVAGLDQPAAACGAGRGEAGDRAGRDRAGTPAPAPTIPLVQQKSALPQLNVKLLFSAGSAHDPAGKEGLAALTAAMIAEAGSQTMTIDQIEAGAVSDGRLRSTARSTRR